jgi:membrane AbrB-like protein
MFPLAGWLAGGMLGVTLLAIANKAVQIIAPIRNLALLTAGLSIGAGVTPQMLRGFGAYPASLALMCAAVGVMTAASVWYLLRIPGFSRETALMASFPGALSYVFALAAEFNADLQRIAVVQVLRVFILTAIVPLIASQSAAHVIAPQGLVDDGAFMLLLLGCAGAAAGLVLTRLQVAGGMIFGAMFVSAFLHGAGIAPGRLPQIFQTIGQVLIGAWIGARFVDFNWSLLRQSIFAALGSFAISAGIGAAFAALASVLLHQPFAETFIAFAPGGLEAMTLLAFALGLNPLYVGVHHLARFILLSACVPLVVRLYLGPRRDL